MSTSSSETCFQHAPNPDWRYLAGLWDGEGCVSVAIQRRKNKRGETNTYWQWRLHMTNTSEKLIRSLAAEFGGSIYINPKIYGEGWKQQHQWIVFNSSECLNILRCMLPFLRYKDEEARVAIEYFEGMAQGQFWHKGPIRISEEEVARRNSLVLRLRSVTGRRKKQHYVQYEGWSK